jgi:hypothetical protein
LEKVITDITSLAKFDNYEALQLREPSVLNICQARSGPKKRKTQVKKNTQRMMMRRSGISSRAFKSV